MEINNLEHYQRLFSAIKDKVILIADTYREVADIGFLPKTSFDYPESNYDGTYNFDNIRICLGNGWGCIFLINIPKEDFCGDWKSWVLEDSRNNQNIENIKQQARESLLRENEI